MKKTIFAAFATLAAAFTSCMSEEDTMFQPYETSLATIELNVSNNPELSVWTRGVTSVDDSELGNWYIKVGGNSQMKVSELTGEAYEPNTYDIKVSSHTDLNASLADGENAGGAYYEKVQQEEIGPGVNSLTFVCEKAQNSKVTVDWSGVAGVSGLEFTNVKAAQDGRTYTYTDCGTTAKSAFFEAGKDKKVTCTLNYTFNGVGKNPSKEIAIAAAATEYKLNISANSNGTITTITISYDDTFNVGGTTSVTIDAATGEEAASSTPATE